MLPAQCTPSVRYIWTVKRGKTAARTNRNAPLAASATMCRELGNGERQRKKTYQMLLERIDMFPPDNLLLKAARG